ncbi:hypothetical protein EB796_009195 [Bugula neritina]|uniref:Autophagy-related protein 101 n=1 Tax=Bugula neritina TaxID=10212 RepID=A0A7J7K3R3_BUGNE|nr:hypothetical protein EB796_009195 [Bugula neritina]
MNCAKYDLKPLELEGHQLEEALNVIFHTILFHRSTGKYTFKSEGRYSIGAIGMEDVDCDRINMTYVRIPSEVFIAKVGNDLRTFCSALRAKEMANVTDKTITGQINLQFYVKSKVNWPRTPEVIPWEDWAVTVNLVSLANENERQNSSQKLRQDLSEIIKHIIRVVNDNDLHMPKEPGEKDHDCVYDTSIPDMQPYLFRILHSIDGDANYNEGLIGATVKKLSQALT